jgi:hypothetical protein
MSLETITPLSDDPIINSGRDSLINPDFAGDHHGRAAVTLRSIRDTIRYEASYNPISHD